MYLDYPSGKNYWVDANGKPTETGNHHDLALKLLAQHKGITHFSYESIYAEMFKLRYLRVNVINSTVYVDAPNISSVAYLSRGQREFIESLALAGKTIIFNGKSFIESRFGRSNANEIVEKLLK